MHAVSMTTAAVCAALLGCAGHDTRTSTGSAAGPREIWIRDVTLISTERAQPVIGAHVHLRGGRIAWIGTTRPPDLAPGATEIDGSGRFLVPGLIDGHVHLVDVPGVDPERDPGMQGTIDDYLRQLPRSYLYFGFTVLVDLAAVEPQRLESLRTAPIGPAIFDCAGSLPIANGYPMVFREPETRFSVFSNFLYDSRQADAIPKSIAPGEHTPAAAVARVAKAGGICVKTYFEPGRLGHPLPTPTAELIRDVVAAAHAHHIPVLLHANSLAAHRFAVETKVDATAHGLWNWETEATPGEIPAAVRQVLDDEVRNGIAVMVTSRIFGGIVDLFDPGFLARPEVAKVLPAGLLSWYRSDAGRGSLAKRLEGDVKGQLSELARRLLRESAGAGPAAAKYFASHGGRLLFGSDTPSDDTYANPPGYNGYLELRELENAGISPRQILDAATRVNAEFFRLDRDYGTIEVGKRDSLLLLRANPLASTSAFDTIELVIVGGRVVPRAELAVK